MNRTSIILLLLSLIILSLNISTPNIDIDSDSELDSHKVLDAFSIDNPSVNMDDLITKLYEDVKVAEVENEAIKADNYVIEQDTHHETEDKITQDIIGETEDKVTQDIVEETEIEDTVEEEIKEDLSNEIPTNGLNPYVLDVIKTYKIGSFPYLLNNDYENYNGVTEDLYFQGKILLKGEPNGTRASNCTGITFEVFYKAMQNRNKVLGKGLDDFNGMSKDDLYDMALIWFVAKGPKSESNLAIAVEKYNLGYRVTDMESLRAGDFIDFSRENNTGHTAVFINWIREGNNIIGLKYWSSQESTNGISYKEEYFNIKDSNGKKYGNIRIENLHMARIK